MDKVLNSIRSSKIGSDFLFIEYQYRLACLSGLALVIRFKGRPDVHKTKCTYPLSSLHIIISSLFFFLLPSLHFLIFTTTSTYLEPIAHFPTLS